MFDAFLRKMIQLDRFGTLPIGLKASPGKALSFAAKCPETPAVQDRERRFGARFVSNFCFILYSASQKKSTCRPGKTVCWGVSRSTSPKWKGYKVSMNHQQPFPFRWKKTPRVMSLFKYEQNMFCAKCKSIGNTIGFRLQVLCGTSGRPRISLHVFSLHFPRLHVADSFLCQAISQAEVPSMKHGFVRKSYGFLFRSQKICAKISWFVE